MQHLSKTYHLRLIAIILLGLAIVLSTDNTVIARTQRQTKKKATKTVSRTHSARISREAELARLKREIAQAERELKEHSRMEKRTANTVAAYDRKTKQLTARLSSLRNEAADLESQVEELDVSIEKTTSTIDTLKLAYAASVTNRYMSGVYRNEPQDTSLLSDPHTSSERIRRAYLSHIVSSALHQSKNELDSTKTTLSENKEAVSESLSEELGQIDATKRAQSSTEEQKRIQAEELRRIQSSKAALQKELARRKASAKKLEGIIANLVAKEEAERKAKERELKRRMTERKKKRSAGKRLSKVEEQQEVRDKIESKSLAGPHSLSWPTGSHKVVQGYGEHRNAEIGTVTINLGIDIGTPTGSAVRAAGDGVVSLISSLPSYGTIVIIRHGGGVHSVYADLGGVSISTGSSVKKGQTIATSGTNSELGAILHFEVWKGRAKQNPLGWLK